MSRTVSSTIVIGFDGSTESSHAAEWAAGEATRRHALLHVVTAFRPYPAGLPGVPEAGAYAVDWVAVGRSMVDGIVQRLQTRHPDLTITGEFQLGDPRPALVQASRSALMTVVGNRGSSRLPEVLTGSVALHLAAHGASPVAVVPNTAIPATGPVLVGVDPRGSSQAALDVAFDEAARRGAELVAVLAGDRVVAHQGFARRPVSPLPVELEEDEAVLSEQLSGWAAKYPDVTVRPRLMNGLPARCLADFAGLTGAEGPQLTVVGNRGHGALAGLVLGSTSHELIATATGPVLVVPVRDDRG
jgi:nucleotide-binding universal stress UspA family protein